MQILGYRGWSLGIGIVRKHPRRYGYILEFVLINQQSNQPVRERKPEGGFREHGSPFLPSLGYAGEASGRLS